MSAGRTGIFGGTFDPIHFAHLAIAEQTREQLRLDRVLFIPAGVPVHKPLESVSPAAHRLAMVERAIEDNPAFEVSTIEIERGGPSYSVDTLEELHRRRPGLRAVFIMSVEAARALSGWKSPQRLLELAEVAVVPRLGYETPTAEWLAAQFPGRDGRFSTIDTPALGHSASDIRARVALGKSIRYLVPSTVEEYIVKHRLYRTS